MAQNFHKRIVPLPPRTIWTLCRETLVNPLTAGPISPPSQPQPSGPVVRRRRSLSKAHDLRRTTLLLVIITPYYDLLVQHSRLNMGYSA